MYQSCSNQKRFKLLPPYGAQVYFHSYIKYQFWNFLNKNTEFKKRNLLTFHNRGRKENYDLLILSFYVLRALSGESEKQSMLAILWFWWKEFVVEVVDCFFYFKSEFLIEKHRWICRRYVQGYVFAHAGLKKRNRKICRKISGARFAHAKKGTLVVVNACSFIISQILDTSKIFKIRTWIRW